MSSILSGETGFDIYTRAVSDVYQDLFGEGSFTGKGIYDLDAFEAAMAGKVAGIPTAFRAVVGLAAAEAITVIPGGGRAEAWESSAPSWSSC